MRALMVSVAAALCAFATAGGASAQTPPPNDYSKPEAWLCLPGRSDACDVPLDATVIAADGGQTQEAFRAAADPGIDCFYVYPTVSTDAGGNSDMTIDPAERRVVAVQFARFRAVCRPFAPMYRQITLAALRGFMTGQPIPADRALAYSDVKAAWDWYLKHENKGRGVVLVGHSQGSGVLTELIRQEIDGKPAQKRLVSALLIGSNVPVVDGRFGTIPTCASPGQTGCLVSYVSFRDTLPPPATSRFGKVPVTGAKAACVNPAAPAGGEAKLHGYLWSGATPGSSSAAAPHPWTKDGPPPSTGFVSVPGLLSARCVEKDGFNYLSVHVNGDPADPRVDDIVGDIILPGGRPDANWGLHLVDVNIAQGDLVSMVAAQAEAWKK
jgi:hypothetical protein